MEVIEELETRKELEQRVSNLNHILNSSYTIYGPYTDHIRIRTDRSPGLEVSNLNYELDLIDAGQEKHGSKSYKHRYGQEWLTGIDYLNDEVPMVGDYDSEVA